MRCFLTMIALAAMLMAAGGCATDHPVAPVSQVDGEPTLVPASVLSKAGLSYYWTSPRLSLRAGETLERIWRLDEKLYLLTSDNRLMALNAATGESEWTRQIAGKGKTVFAPCHADAVGVPKTVSMRALIDPAQTGDLDIFNAVIINTLSDVVVIDRDSDDGEVKRKLKFEFVANSPGCADGGRFYVGAVDGRYHAVRLSEGLVQWTKGAKDTISVGLQHLSGTLFVASQDGWFYAINPDTGTRVWRQRTDGPLVAGFVADPRCCFVPSTDYRIWAYDFATGEKRWEFPTEGPLRQAVQVGVKSVFQYADGDKFYAIDLARGAERWSIPDARTVLGAVDSDVLVLTDKRNLLVVDEILGEVAMSLPMTGLDLFVPNATEPIIYAASRSGYVVCIRPVSAGHLKPEQLKRR